MKKYSCVFALPLTLLFSSNAFAIKPMTKEQFLSDLVGKTQVIERRGGQVIVHKYMDPNGEWASEGSNGGGRTGKWKFDKNGKVCEEWGEGWKCGYYVKEGDGVYSKVRFDNYKQIERRFITSVDVLDGNPKDL
ncbi:MAG: hypothetical protein ABW072_19120 [Sedimenticola sp.]